VTNKGSIQNFFEDFSIGQRLMCPTPRVLTDADRTAYISFTGDRTPAYCNRDGVVHPLIILHTVLGQTVRQISLNAVANLGYAEMIWQQQVRTGEEIRTVVEITGLKENSSGTSGIVYARTTGLNQDSQVVLSYTRWVMVRKRGANATRYLAEPVVPVLQQSVGPDRLPGFPAGVARHEQTGGTFFFEDYEVGERILHEDGMTINSSDHMSFTRLYQNSARVHFDAVRTEGTPLVYGGLPMSVGYAQSFNGLENRAGIRAINGGSHANPVHAGDTLYALTDVLNTSALSGPCGALRLRLFVIKNEQPTESFRPMIVDPRSDKQRYHPNVVLDLDYWELMAKRPKP
jgi:2-methylfumaryl-CoA hydratase